MANENNNTQPPEGFKVFLELQMIVYDAFADLSDSKVPKIIVKSGSGALSIVFDYIEGHTWDQIAGKLFGTAIDAWVISKLGGALSLEARVAQIEVIGTAHAPLAVGIIEGGTVWTWQKYTDYSAGNYFEKAFPAAVNFYKQLLTDDEAAHQLWEDLKNNNDIPAYFRNLTLEQFINDTKDLFNPSYTVPIGGYGVQFEGDKATVVAPDGSDGQAVIVNDILSNRGQVTKIDIGSITYDITQCDNLLVRNAIFDIPKVSFLLSHILIKVGDILDIGDKGLYEVVSDDTMSELAEKFGMTTQQLLSYNTWLIDEGRVEFDQDKVLVANLEPSDFTDKDHNLLGCELEDRLIDHNDGDDTLLGMGGDDYLDGGKGTDQLIGGTGFDTYISDNGDKIFDEDGEGRVIFEDARLTGGKREGGGGGSCDDTPSDDGDNSDDSDKPVEYKGDGGVYTYEQGVLTFTKSSGEVLVINNFKNGDLGITLKSDGDDDGEDPCPEPPTPTPPTPPSPGTPAPSWPYHHGSPLVLDLNNDGTTSTFIYKTSTYFDLDNDGLRERTGWVQGGDGLLTLDKNNDGIINNGNELFGNYTKDSLGKYANNGFDALTKYDDNHDGMINSSDNVYKALKVWQDSNSDGITDDGELKTLSELGISSINLSYVTADALEERNSIRETSTFTTQSTDADGNVTTQVSVVNDVWFDRDVKDTKSTIDYTQISDDIKSLGNVGGSGDVEDLAIAMSKDSVLVAKVEALISAIETIKVNFNDKRMVA